jgi:hypothetical protein
MRRWQRAVAIIAAAPLLAAASPLFATAFQATDVRDKFRSGGEVTVRADETVPHDLYVSGGRVRIDGRVEGDLLVAGGEVDLNGPVQGDLMVAGGTVTIRSAVEGDVRAAGGQVRIEGLVREDALVTAGTFTLTEAGRVGQDLIVGAGQADLDGPVAGSILGSAGDYSRSGVVSGEEDVTVGTDDEPSFLDRVEDAARRFSALLLVGALLLAFAPRAVRSATETLSSRPLPSAGTGLATVVGFALGLILLLLVLVLLALILGLLGFGGLLVASVVGLLLGGGVLTWLLVVVVAWVAYVIVGLALSRLALRRWGGEERTQGLWGRTLAEVGLLALGLLVLVVLTAIPIVGRVVDVAVILCGLGAIVLALWQRRRPAALVTAS